MLSPCLRKGSLSERGHGHGPSAKHCQHGHVARTACEARDKLDNARRKGAVQKGTDKNKELWPGACRGGHPHKVLICNARGGGGAGRVTRSRSAPLSGAKKRQRRKYLGEAKQQSGKQQQGPGGALKVITPPTTDQGPRHILCPATALPTAPVPAAAPLWRNGTTSSKGAAGRGGAGDARFLEAAAAEACGPSKGREAWPA